jgi:endopeptidase La
MNTEDLTNYINYINTNSAYKRKLTEDTTKYNNVVQDAVDTIRNDIADRQYDNFDKYLMERHTHYCNNKEYIRLDMQTETEVRLYNLALYSVMIKIIDDYVAKSLSDFPSYLSNIEGELYKDDSNVDEPNKKKVFTLPLLALLTMLGSKFPKGDKHYQDDDDGDDEDYVPSDDTMDEEDVSVNNVDSASEEPSPKVIKPIKSRLTRAKVHTNKDFINEMFKNSGSSSDEKDISKYYSSLPITEKEQMFDKLKEINDYQKLDKPKLFQIMNFPIPTSQKNHILKQYISLLNSHLPDNKLRSWFDAVLSIPFGKYKGIDLKSIKSPRKIRKFLTKLDTIMNNAVWGHEDAKRQIIQMMGQQIRNPECKGNVLGIWGPPGNGKTTLIKEGIAKAMNKPFVFISLGGATDSSFLEGHSYTYEGSIYGRIANGIINSGCMDPIIYFDELDKISKTPKGEEISNILVHLTDPAQNSHFRDKYFHGIDIDLSRVTIIFSFNNISQVNPILLDRITTIETKYLMKPQKIHIAQNYLLPAIMKETGLKEDDIKLNDNIISRLVEKYTREGGVRKLKSILYNIVRELNLANLMNTRILNTDIVFPLDVTKKQIKHLMRAKVPIQPEKVHKESKVGFITGMYAGSLGVGGVLPIQVVWIPASQPMTLKSTGNLKKVIKESTHVATSLAWNHLPVELQSTYLKAWKERPVGFHIHCPDGAIPKDGPSAGTAITVALYSMLSNKPVRHDVAITGEITLEGNVTAIGGLEEKLVGAKKAGVKLALVPKENEVHLEKVKERNPLLMDDNFNVVLIETLKDALTHSLV